MDGYQKIVTGIEGLDFVGRICAGARVTAQTKETVLAPRGYIDSERMRGQVRVYEEKSVSIGGPRGAKEANVGRRGRDLGGICNWIWQDFGSRRLFKEHFGHTDVFQSNWYSVVGGELYKIVH